MNSPHGWHLMIWEWITINFLSQIHQYFSVIKEYRRCFFLLSWAKIPYFHIICPHLPNREFIKYLCFCQGYHDDCTKQLLSLVCRLKSSVSFLTRPDRPNIAYQKLKGRNPGVIFLPGFNSNMNGQKATALEDFCKSLGHAFIRYIQEYCSWESETVLMGWGKGF